MASASTGTAEAPDPATMEAIRERLIQTGDWDRSRRRLLKVLKERLGEAGWQDDVKDYAKERARTQENPNLEALLQDVTPKAQSMMPPKIRDALIQEIEAVLEREVEPA